MGLRRGDRGAVGFADDIDIEPQQGFRIAGDVVRVGDRPDPHIVRAVKNIARLHQVLGAVGSGVKGFARRRYAGLHDEITGKCQSEIGEAGPCDEL